MKILCTGCAGFIGSVVTEYLVDADYEVCGIDNFRSSFPAGVHPEISFYQGSIGDKELLEDVFSIEKPDVVCHLAAESVIGQSIADPYLFFEQNIIYGLNLLEVMRGYKCNKLVMSSTGSSYGEPRYIPMDESHPQNPINAYGESKYIFERIISWYARSYNLGYIMFRYYNVGGATKDNGERRKNETRLVPTALRCLENNEPITIFGNDYPTRDGTPVRDYLHVRDVAQAHLLAIEKLNSGDKNKVYNLGSETGFTVLEILQKVEQLYGKNLVMLLGNRRPGDPAKLIASSKYAKEDLGWNPLYSDLETIIKDSIEWRERIRK